MTSRRWLSIFFTVLLVSAIVLLGALVHVLNLVRQPSYILLEGNPATVLQDNAFRWHDRHCDVLVYGDSTANVGIDPRVITAKTGLSACNIGVTRPVIDDLGGLPLDSFLAHNPKPRLLVLQFGPEDFYPARSPWEQGGPYQTLMMISRNFSRTQAMAVMLRHPAEAAQFVFFVLQIELHPHNVTPEEQSKAAQILEDAERSNGMLELPFPAQTACRAPALALYGPLDKSWARRWREKYQAMGIPVLIRPSPLPTCDPQLAKFRTELAPYVDGPLEDLPIENFVVGDRHTTVVGSQQETLGLVRLIEAREPALIHHPAP